MPPPLTQKEKRSRCVHTHGEKFSFQVTDFSLPVGNRKNQFRCKKHKLIVENSIHGFLKTKNPCPKCQPKYENSQLEKTGRKRCQKCLKIKNFEAFPNAKKNKSGIDSYCRECLSIKTPETKFIEELRRQGKKRCIRCRQFKRLKDFNKGNARFDKLQPTCRTCQQAINSPNRVLENKLFEKGLRSCRACEETKPFDEFHRSKILRHGINTVCKKCVNARSREYRAANKDKNKEYQKRYHSTPRGRDIGRERVRRRQAQKLMATPSWLTEEMSEAMVEFYTEARKRTEEEGKIYEVDHIVPLISDTVCGLHVPWNLQVLSQYENRQKSNKLIARSERNSSD